MDLLFMRTTRYESEDSSGTFVCLWFAMKKHCFIPVESCFVSFCPMRHAITDNATKLLDLLMQAPVAGMACKWQMELACRCHYGPSDQAPGNKYITTPKRYNAQL